MTAGGGFAAAVRRADPGRADFEAFTHEQLLAMVRHADPEAIAPVGDHLSLAVEKLARIGADLDRHIAYVDWEGVSGAAFREWGTRVARATLGLSDYARSTARALTHAADTLRAVKRDMPPVPVAALVACTTLRVDPTVRHDPDAQAQMVRAHAEVEAARIDAADQMRKLAQSYSLSATVIGTAEPPEYPPMPSPFVPPSQARRTDTHHDGAAMGPAVPLPVRGSPEAAGGGEVDRNAAALSDSSTGAPGSAASPLTRTQSTGAPAPAVSAEQCGAPPNGGSGGAHLGGPHPGNAAHPFTSGALPHDHSRDAGASGTTRQLPRNLPRQALPKVPYDRDSGLLPAGGGQGRGAAGETAEFGGLAQRPAAYGAVGEYGPPLRPPVGGVVGGRTGAGGRAASGGSGARRLAVEPGGVVGRTPAADFAPRPLGSPGSTGEEPDGSRHPADVVRAEDWGSRRDDVVPPVIR